MPYGSDALLLASAGTLRDPYPQKPEKCVIRPSSPTRA